MTTGGGSWVVIGGTHGIDKKGRGKGLLDGVVSDMFGVEYLTEKSCRMERLKRECSGDASKIVDGNGRRCGVDNEEPAGKRKRSLTGSFLVMYIGQELPAIEVLIAKLGT
jgi:hypothetical protein